MTDIPEDVKKLALEVARVAVAERHNQELFDQTVTAASCALIADRAAQAERMARLEAALREWVEADDAWQGSFEDDVRIERAKDAARALSQEGSDA